MRTARAHAKDRGRTVSQTVADRLTETLDAALVDPGAAQLLRSGRLASALRHVGFGVVDESGEPAKLAPMKPRVVRRTHAKAPVRRATRPQPPAVDQALERRRAELRTPAEEVEAEYAEAESERAEAESLPDGALGALDRAERTAAIARRRRDATQQRLVALDA